MLARIPLVARVALVAALVPPTWVGLTGGADLDFAGWRFDFYRTGGPAAALLGSLALCALPAARGATDRVLRGIAFLAFGLVVFVSYTNGFQSEALRIRSPGRAAQVGCLFVVVSLALVRGRLSAGRGLRGAAAGLALGLGVTAALHAADRADLERHLADAPASARSPDVIFLLVDTLRADALGAYGADPSPSPFLDGLASESVVFERALSQAPWTVPSVSSLMSSLYPSSFLRKRTFIEGDRYILLPEGVPWLPELLRRAGYHTASFVKNPLLQSGTRFERGFDVHEWVRGNTAEHHSARQLVDAVLRWGDVMADQRAEAGVGSFFLYVHFMDPHIEYRPPEAYSPDAGGYEGSFDGGVKSVHRVEEQAGGPRPEDLARMWALYEAEVAYLDDQLARLRAGLAARELWTDETVVVVVADHGEQFFEHGQFLHGDVQWENLHVPFLLRAPGATPRRIPEPVGMLDVAPTLLDWLGLPIPEGMEGRSLAPRVRGAPPAPAVVVSEIAKGHREDVRLTAPGWSLITGRPDERLEPMGGASLPPEDAEGPARAALETLRDAARRHRERLRRFAGEETPKLEIPDADTRDRLRALGYAE